METERNKYENDNVLIIAASNSSDMDKARADYVCAGTNVQIQFKKAIDKLKEGSGGTVLLTDRQYDFVDNEVLNKDDNIIKGVCGKSAEISEEHTNGFHSYIASNKRIHSCHDI